MKTYNDYPFPEDEVYEREVMCFFNCDKAMAKTIIESSKMNGQSDGIKKMCHDHNRKENRKHGS